MGRKSKDKNNNDKATTDTTTTEASQNPKKTKWRRILARFTRKKPATPSPSEPEVTAFDSTEKIPQSSENPHGCIEKRKKRKAQKKPVEEERIDASATWKSARRSRSEGNVIGTSSKKKKKRTNVVHRKGDEVDVEVSQDKQTIDEDAKPEEPPPTLEATQLDASAKTAKKTSKEDDADGSAKTARRRSKSADRSTDDPLSMSQSFKRGFRNFRDNRAKNLKAVKTFMSRKYQDRAMEKVVAQVEARQQKRSGFSEATEQPGTNGKLHQGDDVFPQRRPHGRPKSNREPKAAVTYVKPQPPTQSPPATSVDATGLVLIETNNNNEGELFLPNGRPFWQQVGKGKPGEADDDEELTDDELPMNAEVILDVHRGKIALVDMPTDPVTLDPYGPAISLEAHDKAFFTRDLIFSNTVRSMINLNDDLTDEAPKRPPRERRCNFILPEKIHRYSRKHPDNFKEESFTPKHAERK